MNTPCIVIADRARARFFTLEAPSQRKDPRFEPGRRLVEHQDLVNPEGKLTDAQLYRDRPGRKNRSTVPGSSYGTEDGKGRSRAPSTRKFAKEVSSMILEFMKSKRSEELVVVAAPRFLGVLRAEFRGSLPKYAGVTELAEDLSWHTVAHIEDVLVRRGVLPPRKVPDTAYRARGLLKEDRTQRGAPKEAPARR